MSVDNLPWDAAAVIIWLLPGDNADEDDFCWEWVDSPPEQNPHEWGTLREAVEYANTVDCAHGKGAWIKVGEQILNPVEVYAAYQRLTGSAR